MFTEMYFICDIINIKLLNRGALSFRMLLENSEHHFHGLLRDVVGRCFQSQRRQGNFMWKFRSKAVFDRLYRTGISIGIIPALVLTMAGCGASDNTPSVSHYEPGNGYTDEELISMARDYYLMTNEAGRAPSIIEIDSREGDEIVLHLYELVDDGNGQGHTATYEWYSVNRFNAEGEDFMGNPVDFKNNEKRGYSSVRPPVFEAWEGGE